MKIRDVIIEDNYVEAFPILCSEVLITAATEYYAKVCAVEATGFGTTILGCPSESGISTFVTAEQSPDYRPGYVIMVCQTDKDKLKQQLIERIGECVLTAPTTAMFNWTPFERKEDKTQEKRLDVRLHFFGDGYESKVKVGERNCWKIPIMGGDFVCEEEIGYVEGLSGASYFIMGKTLGSALIAAQAAVDVLDHVPGAISPFLGGIMAAGAKEGSKKYPDKAEATTNERLCPSIRSQVPDSDIPDGVEAVFQIIVNGMNREAVERALRNSISAACTFPGVVKIAGSNHGGPKGPYRFDLRDILQLP